MGYSKHELVLPKKIVILYSYLPIGQLPLSQGVPVVEMFDCISISGVSSGGKRPVIIYHREGGGGGRRIWS